jgi:hypothetical protein
MSPTPGLVRVASTAEPQRSDPRLHRRYPITLDVQYKLLNKDRKKRFGFARTLNMSSVGVLLAADDSLPASSLIELAINWPFLLNGVCPLRLVMRGRIVRSDSNGVAIQVWHHEFRTAGPSPFRGRPTDDNGRSNCS